MERMNDFHLGNILIFLLLISASIHLNIILTSVYLVTTKLSTEELMVLNCGVGEDS